MSNTPKAKLTWAQIIKLEPGLKAVERGVRNVKDDPARRSFCANAAWYGYAGYPGLKDWMVSLVGFEAPRKELRTMEAYDLAYRRLYEQLPHCRNCNCF